MNDDLKDQVRAAAERVMEITEEVEASGHATLDAAGLEAARAALHAWVDALTGVVINPALGRVTLIHGAGRASTISSPDLAFAMSAPIGK